jgi:hypothetical protein
MEKYFLMRKNSSVNPFDPEYYHNQTWLHLTQALILVKLKVSYQWPPIALARPCARKDTRMDEKPKTKYDKVEQNINFLLVSKQVHLRKSQLKVHRSTNSILQNHSQ